MRSFVSRTLVLVLVLVLLVRMGALSCSLPLRRRSLRARHVPPILAALHPPRPPTLAAACRRRSGRGNDRRVRRFVSRQHRQRVLQRDANGPGVLLQMNTALVKSPNVPFSAAFLSCSSELGGLRASAWSSASRAT